MKILSFIQTCNRVVKYYSAGIAIDSVSVQKLLMPFFCDLGKDTLRQIAPLGGLGMQF